MTWQHELHPRAEAAFEALHGANGAWVGRLRQHVGDSDTQMLRDEQPHHDLIVDRWTSPTGYAWFLDAAVGHYARIDARGDAL